MTREPRVIEITGDEPLTLAEAKLHLRVDGTNEDALIDALIVAAREHCEQFLGLSLSTRTLEIALDEWPDDDEIVLPGGPVREITSIMIGGVEADLDGYILDDYSTAAQLLPAASWTILTAATNTIKVRYLAGYGIDEDGGELVPAPIRAAMLLVIGHLFERREASVERGLTEIPLGVEALLRPYRVRLGMA